MQQFMSTFSSDRLFLWATQGDASLPANQADEGCVVINGRFNSEYRLTEDGVTAELKPSMSLTATHDAISINDTTTIADVPAGAKLLVLGESEKVEGDSASFSADLAGTYNLLFSHPLYLDTIVEIVVT